MSVHVTSVGGILSNFRNLGGNFTDRYRRHCVSQALYDEFVRFCVLWIGQSTTFDGLNYAERPVRGNIVQMRSQVPKGFLLATHLETRLHYLILLQLCLL